MNNILVVAVHPDDETLGCGGTLLRHKAEGKEIHWLIVTSIYTEENGVFKTHKMNGEKVTWNNAGPLHPAFPADRIEKRAEQIKSVSRAYGFDSVHELSLPAMCLDQVPTGEIIGKISDVMKQVRPDTVILPFKADVHSDHRITFDAAFSCTKSFRYPFITKLLMMEIISETDFAPSLKDSAFIPNMFIDIGDYIDRKVNIMGLYEEETAKHPYPRNPDNIKALALNRGACANCDYAESFVLLKEIL